MERFEPIKQLRQLVFVDSNQSQQRIEICQTCTDYDCVNERCNLCHCYMQFKTQLKHSKCPIGKW